MVLELICTKYTQIYIDFSTQRYGNNLRIMQHYYSYDSHIRIVILFSQLLIYVSNLDLNSNSRIQLTTKFVGNKNQSNYDVQQINAIVHLGIHSINLVMSS